MTSPSQQTVPQETLSVPIRPDVGMYAAFTRLNYKPWYAIAEFVDNALQSFLASKGRLAKAGTKKLTVEIRLESDTMRIYDNACGIALSEMSRAFAPAQPPTDRTGLSEFGLGMKAAACWFANQWVVRTSALGDPFEREVAFNVAEIVAQGTEELIVNQRPAASIHHFTVLELTELRVQPKSRTVSKIREHLASIYRQFLRRGDLEIRFVTPSTSESLTYSEPDILTLPYFRTPDADPVIWHKDIEMDVGEGQRVWGWAGLLATASTTRAGFAVFRRDRLIEGSADETWRPQRIFKTPNRYTYQRLVGELHVEGFSVSHTKDGIQWGTEEEAIQDLLHDEIDSKPLCLIQQAEGHRVRKRVHKTKPSFGQSAVDTTGDALTKRAQPIIQDQIAHPAEDPQTEPSIEQPEMISAERIVEIRPHDDHRIWRFAIQIIRDRSKDWYSCDPPTKLPSTGINQEIWRVVIQLNLDHPFSECFINDCEAIMTPIVRIVAGLALAETTSREAGTRHAGRVRRHFNKLLRHALSREGEQ